MPKKTKEEANKTRARILASALKLFTQKGYEKTTFPDIAAKLKMTKGAVYWHFESKEELLLALINEMLVKFSTLISFEEAHSFPVVVEKMVQNAKALLKDAKAKAFFLLMHEQIRWSSSTMDEVRAKLLRDNRWGPWEAFRTAVANDLAAGRVRADVKPEEIATLCIVIWNGLVHGQIVQFFPCEMEAILHKTYTALWNDIKQT